MTIPTERKRAVNSTRDFLRDLVDPKATPRVPGIIRRQARSLLRHYPSEFDMDIIAEREDSSTENTNPISYKVFSDVF